MGKPLKPPMTYDEQIRNLIDKHNLVVADVDRAKEILRTVNYYRLSGYGIGLLNCDTDLYDGTTSIEDLHALYCFDTQLRNIISPVIEFVEVKMRTAIAYHLANKYGSECYRDPQYFRTWYSKIKQKDMFADFIDHVDSAIKQQRNKPFVIHHNKEYGGHFPVWVIVEVLSFGSLSTLYSLMKQEDQAAVAKEFHTKPVYMISWFASFVELRNICAHYSRLYNMPLDSTPKLPPRDTSYSQCRLFSACLALKYITRGNDVWNVFVRKLKEIISRYPIANISYLGFPNDWEEIL